MSNKKIPIVSIIMGSQSDWESVKPVIKDLKHNNIFFSGIFYAGLILTKYGPKLLEINVRFGDSEAQAVLPRLKADLLDLLLASSKGKLDQL